MAAIRIISLLNDDRQMAGADSCQLLYDKLIFLGNETDRQHGALSGQIDIVCNCRESTASSTGFERICHVVD